MDLWGGRPQRAAGLTAVTKTEKFKLAKAIFRVAHLPGADFETCVAVAQSVVQEFGAHDGFTHFVVSATGMWTDRDLLAELSGKVNGQ